MAVSDDAVRVWRAMESSAESLFADAGALALSPGVVSFQREVYILALRKFTKNIADIEEAILLSEVKQQLSALKRSARRLANHALHWAALTALHRGAHGPELAEALCTIVPSRSRFEISCVVMNALRVRYSDAGLRLCERLQDLVERWMQTEWPKYAADSAFTQRWCQFMMAIDRLSFIRKAPSGLQLKLILRFVRELTHLFSPERWVIAFRAALAIGAPDIAPAFLFVSIVASPRLTGIAWTDAVKYRWVLFSSWMIDVVGPDTALLTTYQSLPQQRRRLLSG
jgi:hypothetical protein